MGYPSRMMGSGIAASAALEITGRVADNLVATGTTQSDALFIPTTHNIVVTTASGTGVRLPAPEQGCEVTVKNLGANALLVYPATGGAINALSANAGFSVAAGGQVRLLGRNSTNWVTY